MRRNSDTNNEHVTECQSLSYLLIQTFTHLVGLFGWSFAFYSTILRSEFLFKRFYNFFDFMCHWCACKNAHTRMCLHMYIKLSVALAHWMKYSVCFTPAVCVLYIWMFLCAFVYLCERACHININSHQNDCKHYHIRVKMDPFVFRIMIMVYVSCVLACRISKGKLWTLNSNNNTRDGGWESTMRTKSATAMINRVTKRNMMYTFKMANDSIQKQNENEHFENTTKAKRENEH